MPVTQHAPLRHAPLRHAIVNEAYTWLNTPYQHQGRVKSNTIFKGGVDCGGLVIAVGNTLGLWCDLYFDYCAYDHDISEDLLLHLFDRYLIRKDKPCGGDIFLLLIGGKIQHAGIFTFANTMIHTCSRAGKVIETDCTPKLWQRVIRIYQYPLLGDA